METTKTILICRLIEENGKNVAARVAAKTGVSRQTASTWLAKLKDSGIVEARGVGRGREYSLLNLTELDKIYGREGLDEDVVWRELGHPVVQDLPENVGKIWHYGITEMVNNAVDHSGSETVTVRIKRNALYTQCEVTDEGEGIFLKIQRALNLYDPREAILELAKGKFTTDPANHSGEGIFFSSRMFDIFVIQSDSLSFVHNGNDKNDVLLAHDPTKNGTTIAMRLHNDSSREMKEVFDRFTAPEEFSFAKTVVPVRLAQYEGETLVSRSQAKRLTRRFDRFETVILDFAGVNEIGQAFADEVFRVFSNAHPTIKMMPIHLTPDVQAMINRVRHSIIR